MLFWLVMQCSLQASSLSGQYNPPLACFACCLHYPPTAGLKKTYLQATCNDAWRAKECLRGRLIDTQLMLDLPSLSSISNCHFLQFICRSSFLEIMSFLNQITIKTDVEKEKFFRYICTQTCSKLLVYSQQYP